MFIRVLASLWVLALGVYGLRSFMQEEDGGMMLAILQAIVLIALWAPVQ